MSVFVLWNYTPSLKMLTFGEMSILELLEFTARFLNCGILLTPGNMSVLGSWGFYPLEDGDPCRNVNIAVGGSVKLTGMKMYQNFDFISCTLCVNAFLIQPKCL